MEPSSPVGAAAEPQAARAMRSRLRLAGLGALVVLASFLTYFLVFPSWPDLRDSGHPSVAVAALGVALTLPALAAAWRSRRRRRGATALFLIAAIPAGLMAFYIYWLSYDLPSTEGVIAVGARAPPFRLPDQDGRERTLEEFAGRPVYLIFFRGHW